MGKYEKHYSKGGSSAAEIAESVKEREDKAFDLYAEMLIEKIESASQSEWKKPWFTDGQICWPKALYGKSYNGMNALMLSLLCEKEGYGIPVFATRDRIFGMNFANNEKGERVPALDKEGKKLPFVHILKGEHCFPVFLTQVNVIKKDTLPKVKIKWSDYVKLSSEEKNDYNVYYNRRVYNVFNVDQTNMKEARPELYQKLKEENLPKKLEVTGDVFTFEPLDLMVENDKWICPIKPQYGDKAYYSISKKEIVLPLKDQFVVTGKPEAYYGTMLHEMVHSTGAEDQLDRIKPSSFGSDDYAREELVAELGAAILCMRYGFGKYVKDDTVPYVQSWLGSLKENPEYIRTVLKDIKMATSVVDVRIENIRNERLGEKADDKLDVREENESILEFDESGDAYLGQSESLVSDKKQGEGEGKGPAVSEQGKPEEHHHTGLRW